MKKIASILFVLALASCGTSPETRFYNLSSVPDTQGSKIVSRNIFIGVDNVSVAGYVDRPQIVTIKDSTELNMSEYNRWAESLSYSMQRVIAENISANMKNGMAKPMNGGNRGYDYIVFVELNKFDGKFGGTAELDAWWSVNDKDGKVVAREHTALQSPLGKDYNDFVQKQNELIAKLSKEIAGKISKLK